MGHGKKNANRGEAINRNTGRIKRLAQKHNELAQILKKVRTELKDDIEGIISDVRAIDARIENLANIVAFNALPFWKRWWLKWKETRETLKDVHKPIFIEANVEEVEDAKEEETEVAADAESPASDSGPEDTGAEEKEGEAEQEESRVS